MLGFLNLPDRANADITVLRANTPQGSTVLCTQAWQKPRGAKFVYGFLLAGGAGGGAGLSSGGATVGGGSGGGSSASLAFLAPASLIPDVLYVSVGMGGPGGPAGQANGTNGQPTVVSPVPSINASALNAGQLFRVEPGGLGGALGTTGAPVGGVGGTVTAQFLSLSVIALVYTVAGQQGGSGSTTIGGAVAWGSTTTSPASGGAGGGGVTTTTTDHAGGAITAPDVGFEPLIITIPGGLAGNVAANRGNDGICPAHYGFAPFYSTGGTGGGSNHGLTGGVGGNGALGSGGAGGGGGTTGGAGGNGGDGLVVLAAF